MVRRRTARSRLRWLARCRRTAAGSCPPSQLFTDAILLQAAIQRTAAHAELLRRESNVSAVAREDLFDEDAFGILERLRCRPGCCRSVTWQVQIANANFARGRIRHQHRALDAVSELTDVPGPSVRGQCVDRGGGEALEALAIAPRVVAEKMRGQRGDVL